MAIRKLQQDWKLIMTTGSISYRMEFLNKIQLVSLSKPIIYLAKVPALVHHHIHHVDPAPIAK